MPDIPPILLVYISKDTENGKIDKENSPGGDGIGDLGVGEVK